jgi:phosphoenolpyruvate synthase/pyruvate phosphate dikinase/glycerol-3-phosphate acyltransferase PlsY
MTLTQVWGALFIFTACPLLGGLPFIAWITYALTRRKLAQLGTGNVSVSAAFYHGGTWVGILAVLSEAGKGIIAVLLARYLFPGEAAWELVALIMLIMGRYLLGKGAGTTNLVWGVVVHDWQTALLVFLIGAVSFTGLRSQIPAQRLRSIGRYTSLVLFPAILGILHPDDLARIVAAIALSILLAGIYYKIPDDLDLPVKTAKAENQTVFSFFKGVQETSRYRLFSAIISLDKQLDAQKVGQKAATLSLLKRLGYSVPDGWTLLPGDNPKQLIKRLTVSGSEPLIVRSSAIGEDSEEASAAGQYTSILNVTTKSALQEAIAQVLVSYHNPAAIQYRLDRQLSDTAMAVLIQKQILGVFSGVAFSRDPISQQGNAVVIEALPGDATQVVSGRVTPEQYRVYLNQASDSPLIEGNGQLPAALIQEVAVLARRLEDYYHGIPQDLEWTYDGAKLWLLQARPITTLQPIWTRKIAAEVIPGIIRPLTWSINRPLTCGVWGEIFTIVLGSRANGLDFNQTATLHYSHAYFNATLLGQIFRRMGLPAESLEFLTRGAKFSKPPTRSTLQNLPGLFRLLGREWNLAKDFQLDYQTQFAPILSQLTTEAAASLAPPALLERVKLILSVLKRATYYSILAPLSASLRQSLLRVEDAELDNTQTPEVASLRSLADLAQAARHLLKRAKLEEDSAASLFATLAEIPDGQSILDQFNQFLDRYGYLSEVATDIAVSTWKEDPRTIRALFAQFVTAPPPPSQPPTQQRWQAQQVQARLNLKGQVTEVYSQLLAHLRWSMVAIEAKWLEAGWLGQAGDIFYLEYGEIKHLVEENEQLLAQLPQIIAHRRSQLETQRQLSNVPALVYGNTPPVPLLPPTSPSQQRWQGIGASAGQVEGLIKVIINWQALPEIDSGTILVVPYTDSGWAPLLAQAGGLIAEVGGRLSHGAIVAREYGIPAVMDIQNATQILQDGQRVRIDGQLGLVEILN